MSEFMRFWGLLFGACLCIAAGCAAVFFGIALTGNWFECQSFHDGTGINTRRSGFECYVEQDGKYIPMWLYKKQAERNLNIRINQ